MVGRFIDSTNLIEFSLLFISLSGFKIVMLSGVRALVEQQPVADDYTKYK